MRHLLLLASVALAAVLVACGDDTPDSAAPSVAPAATATPTPQPTVAATPAGAPIAVAEALGGTFEAPLLVAGAILAKDSEVRLCEALAESFPPQCPANFLVVEGLDLAAIDGLTTAQGVTWSDRPVEVFGAVRDGVLTVADGRSGPVAATPAPPSDCEAQFLAGLAIGDVVGEKFACIDRPLPGAAVGGDLRVAGYSAGAF